MRRGATLIALLVALVLVSGCEATRDALGSGTPVHQR